MRPFKVILIILSLFLTSAHFAQVKDKENKSIRIPAEPSKIKKDSTPVKIKVAPKLDKKYDKAGGDKAEAKKKFTIKESEKPFSMTDGDGLKSPSEIYEKRWSKDLEKGGVIKTMSDFHYTKQNNFKFS